MASKRNKKHISDEDIKEIEYLSTLLKYTLRGIQPGTMNEKINALFDEQAKRLRFKIDALKQANVAN